MTYERLGLGMTGEDLACRELEQRGYAILARRYRGKTGEIDIVAREGDSLVFVEVKARASREFGSAAEAVTPMKQRQLLRVANEYLVQHRIHDCPCRFDVVAIQFEKGSGPHAGAAEIVVFQNAFDA